MENVRGRDMFIVQPTCPPANDNLMELLMMTDACRRASAKRITAVVPYFGYARQDRRPRATRVAIAAKLVANMVASAGVDRLADGRFARGSDSRVFRHPGRQRVRLAGAARATPGSTKTREHDRGVAGCRRRGARARTCEAARRCRVGDHRQAPAAPERVEGDEHHRRSRGQELRAGRRHGRHRRARCARRRRR